MVPSFIKVTIGQFDRLSHYYRATFGVNCEHLTCIIWRTRAQFLILPPPSQGLVCEIGGLRHEPSAVSIVVQSRFLLEWQYMVVVTLIIVCFGNIADRTITDM